MSSCLAPRLWNQPVSFGVWATASGFDDTRVSYSHRGFDDTRVVLHSDGNLDDQGDAAHMEEEWARLRLVSEFCDEGGTVLPRLKSRMLRASVRFCISPWSKGLFEPLQGIEQKELGPSSGRSFQGVFVFHPNEQGCQSCSGWSCVHDARRRVGPSSLCPTGVLPLLDVIVATTGYDLAVVEGGTLTYGHDGL